MKRRHLGLNEKIELIKIVERFPRIDKIHLANRYGISLTTVYRILRRKYEHLDTCVALKVLSGKPYPPGMMNSPWL